MLKLRPALFRVINAPLHSRHMEPSCTAYEILKSEGSTRVPGARPTMSSLLESSTAEDSHPELDSEPLETRNNGAETGEPKQPSMALYVRLSLS
jgi:hypothetical protein